MLKLRSFIKTFISISSRINATQSVREITLRSTTKKSTPFRRFDLAPLIGNRLVRKVNISFQTPPARVFIALNILTWLGFVGEDEEKESELIMTLKRAVLCTQREQYDKAEQLLHVALRLAQQQMNEQGVLYCYDLMANLAMEQQQLDKSETLFVEVLKRLLHSGVAQDDLKVIHISLKLARISHFKASEQKAELGYLWCLEQIDKHKNGDDPNVKGLSGIIHDWYAQFLLDLGDVEKSLKHLNEAYNACCEVKGKNDSQSALLLNDLGITNWRAGNLSSAENCLNEAIAIGKTLEDQSHVGVFVANLGLLYLYKGMIGEAEKNCKEALKIGTKVENTESVEHAKYCFDQISDYSKP